MRLVRAEAMRLLTRRVPWATAVMLVVACAAAVATTAAGPARPVFAGAVDPLVHVLIALLAGYGFVVGASWMGAELPSGDLDSLLVWRPERLAVFGAKLGVLLGLVLALSVVATAAYLGALWTLAQVGGTVGDVTGPFWTDLGWLCARGFGLALVAAALGFAAATLGHGTTVAIGALAGYAALWELGGRAALAALDVAHPDAWLLRTYAMAWVDGERQVGGGLREVTVGWPVAGLVLTGLLAACLAGAAAAFRRRDLV